MYCGSSVFFSVCLTVSCNNKGVSLLQNTLHEDQKLNQVDLNFAVLTPPVVNSPSPAVFTLQISYQISCIEHYIDNSTCLKWLHRRYIASDLWTVFVFYLEIFLHTTDISCENRNIDTLNFYYRVAAAFILMVLWVEHF